MPWTGGRLTGRSQSHERRREANGGARVEVEVVVVVAVVSSAEQWLVAQARVQTRVVGGWRSIPGGGGGGGGYGVVSVVWSLVTWWKRYQDRNECCDELQLDSLSLSSE